MASPPCQPRWAQAGWCSLARGASRAEAESGWEAAQKTAGGLLEGLSPVIVTVALPGRGTFHRLRVPAPGAAGAFCRALSGRGLACLPVGD